MFYTAFASLLSLVAVMSGGTQVNNFALIDNVYDNGTIASSYFMIRNSNTLTYTYDNSSSAKYITNLTGRFDRVHIYSGYDDDGTIVGQMTWSLYHDINEEDLYFKFTTSNSYYQPFNLRALVSFRVKYQDDFIYSKYLDIDFSLEQYSNDYAFIETDSVQYLNMDYALTGDLSAYIQINYVPISEDTFNNSFNGGFNSGYESGYDDGQEAGKVIGYQTGYTDGYTQGATQDAVAVSIFSGIISVGLLPINFFLACLNFEVFGINIGAFVSAMLTVAIVVIVTRLIVNGGTGGNNG